MTSLLSLYDRTVAALGALAIFLVPTLARLTFAAVLLLYFWSSGLTKIGPGVMGFLAPTDGAYIQIFPKAVEAAGYDTSQLGTFHWAVAVAGTVAEFLFPLLIVLGLLTRLASLGMLGFIFVQSLTDVYGHGVSGDDLGRLFDAASGALILDQRALWAFLLATLVLVGGGPLSLDRLFRGSGSRRA